MPIWSDYLIVDLTSPTAERPYTAMCRWQSENPPGAAPDSFEPHTLLGMEQVGGEARAQVPLPAKALAILGPSARARFDTSN